MGRKRKYHTEEEKVEAKRLARKKYCEANKEKVKSQVDKWYQNNKEHKKSYYQTNKKPLTEEQKENKKLYMKEYLNSYKEVIKQRRLTDPLFRLKCSTRGLIGNAITRMGYSKNSKTEEILGCTFEEFKKHIESQWEPWMNWDNYGKYNGEENHGWDIDHMIPTSSAINENEIIELNHYTNLQPLCSFENRMVKRDNIFKMDF